MSVPHSPHQNHLLDALPTNEYERLNPYLERIPMALGEVLYESGDMLNYLYFPTTCIVSLLYVMENGASAEIAVVGNEGLIGVALFMGGQYAEPRRRPERRIRLSDTEKPLHAGIRTQRVVTPCFAPLYPGTNFPDGSDRRLQPPSFGGPTALPLAVAEP